MTVDCRLEWKKGNNDVVLFVLNWKKFTTSQAPHIHRLKPQMNSAIPVYRMCDENLGFGLHWHHDVQANAVAPPTSFATLLSPRIGFKPQMNRALHMWCELAVWWVQMRGRTMAAIMASWCQCKPKCVWCVWCVVLCDLCFFTQFVILQDAWNLEFSGTRAVSISQYSTSSRKIVRLS